MWKTEVRTLQGEGGSVFKFPEMREGLVCLRNRNRLENRRRILR